MTAPEPFTLTDPDDWTEARALARVLDLVTVAERHEPAWRYVTCADLRLAITEGLDRPLKAKR